MVLANWQIHGAKKTKCEKLYDTKGDEVKILGGKTEINVLAAEWGLHKFTSGSPERCFAPGGAGGKGLVC